MDQMPDNTFFLDVKNEQNLLSQSDQGQYLWLEEIHPVYRISWTGHSISLYIKKDKKQLFWAIWSCAQDLGSSSKPFFGNF